VGHLSDERKQLLRPSLDLCCDLYEVVDTQRLGELEEEEEEGGGGGSGRERGGVEEEAGNSSRDVCLEVIDTERL
jgi:hypothetical protein